MNFIQYLQQIEERSIAQDIAAILGKTVWRQNYILALSYMERYNVSSAVAARIFKHVDARVLQQIKDKGYEL